jgi:hypothetical protein
MLISKSRGFKVDNLIVKYDKQDQQCKAVFNEQNPHITQQQEPVARSPVHCSGGRGFGNFPDFFSS